MTCQARHSIKPPDEPICFGTDAGSDRFDGELDEVRLQRVVRSAPWLAYAAAAGADRVIIYGQPAQE